MKNFLSSLLILLISSSSVWACVPDEVKIDEKTYKVCKSGKYSLLSEGCKDVQSCFPVKGIKITLLPTQNPAFTLCEKIAGRGVSGVVKSSKTIETFCLLNEKIVDMNQLFKAR